MNDLKKIYLRVKAQSNNFKSSPGETYTGDELFFLTIQLQTLIASLETDLGEDQKLKSKLICYVEPFPK